MYWYKLLEHVITQYKLYRDWSAEPTPDEVKKGAPGPYILSKRSGLGGPSPGHETCLVKGPFGKDKYDPEGGTCLKRHDKDTYTRELTDCAFTRPPSLMDKIDEDPEHGKFTNSLEGNPHVNPHVCIGGNMESQNSPDDPIFMLHHAFVDYLYALWQDCHNYDQVAAAGATKSKSNAYSGDINSVLPMPHNKDIGEQNKYKVKDVLDLAATDVIYEKGMFWRNAHVNDEENCGKKGAANINEDWFYEDPAWFEGMDHPFLNFGHPKKKGTPKKKKKKVSSSSSSSSSGGKRRRMMVSASIQKAEAIYQRLQQTMAGVDHKALVHQWAVKSCQADHARMGLRCPIPDDFEDCADMPINPETKDIDITLKQLVERRGINECMKMTSKNFYKWAKMSHSLKSLCAGCLDAFCDRTPIKAQCDAIAAAKNDFNGIVRVGDMDSSDESSDDNAAVADAPMGGYVYDNDGYRGGYNYFDEYMLQWVMVWLLFLTLLCIGCLMCLCGGVGAGFVAAKIIPNGYVQMMKYQPVDRSDQDQEI